MGACSISTATGSRPRGRPLASPVWLEPPASELNSQRLFRVHYDGPDGDGSLRLALRLAHDRRFQITASDALGRALWSLEARKNGSLFIQHRRRTYCRTGGDVVLPQVTLSSLPVRALPSVLLGYLPIPPGGGELAEEIDFVDREGRRWTGRAKDGDLAAWTLWGEGEPILWWTRKQSGGVLSHRRGAQFRWRQVVSEPLAGGLEQLRVPDGYRRESCEESGLSQRGEDSSGS